MIFENVKFQSSNVATHYSKRIRTNEASPVIMSNILRLKTLPGVLPYWNLTI